MGLVLGHTASANISQPPTNGEVSDFNSHHVSCVTNWPIQCQGAQLGSIYPEDELCKWVKKWKGLSEVPSKNEALECKHISCEMK